MLTIDEVIHSRLKKAPPLGCTVVPNSTPVIAFGKFREAKVATISLNPSYKEFDNLGGRLRFHTLQSLGVNNYDDIDEQHQKKILDYCERYFERPGIAYSAWFNKVSRFLKESTGYDYYNGSACHLDLCQWATLDIWGKLSPDQKKALVSSQDIELLLEVIKQGNIHTILLNGKSTVEELHNYLDVRPKRVQLRQTKKIEGKTNRKLVGYVSSIDKILDIDIGREIKIIGWNSYLKYASNEEEKLLIEWIKSL